jgi:hypothetical protein
LLALDDYCSRSSSAGSHLFKAAAGEREKIQLHVAKFGWGDGKSCLAEKGGAILAGFLTHLFFLSKQGAQFLACRLTLICRTFI